MQIFSKKKKINLNIRTKKTNSSLLLDNSENQKKMNTLNMEISYQNLMKNTPTTNNKKIEYLKTQPNFYNKKKYKRNFFYRKKYNKYINKKYKCLPEMIEVNL